MTDLFTPLSLGEYVKDGTEQTEVVEYDGTIAAGQGLKTTGINADGQSKVVVGTAGVKCSHVALYAGVDGDFRVALKRGTVKVTFSGNTVINEPVKVATDGKFAPAVLTVTVPTGGAGTGDGGALTVEGGIACGYSKSDGASDGDTGLIFFEGS